MKKLLFALLLFPLLCNAQTSSQAPQDYVDLVLKASKELQHSAVGLMAVDEEGNTIARWNSDMRLSTASTMKLVSTGLGLLALGPGYRYETSLALTGEADADGTLHGDIYIIGGGDPTLGSADEVAVPIDSVFGIWADAIQARGISSVEGQIVGDARYFADEMTPGTWEWGDLGYYYGSGTAGLNFAENLSSFEFTPGKAEGEPVLIRPVAPFSPEMTYLNEATTSAGTGENIIYETGGIFPVGKFRGTYGVRRRVDTLNFSNKFPAESCACAFSEFLAGRGILSDGYSDLATAAYEEMDVVCTTYSPELRDIVSVTNHISNNFFAETIFKSLSKVDSSRTNGSYREASVKAYLLLGELGPDMSGYKQVDGSGLTARNLASPRFFCEFLSEMEDSPVFGDFLSSLPQPGEKGTLKNVLANEKYSVKRKVHAKSGSMTGVKCYAGYVEHNGGYIKFAVMLNNYTCPNSRIKPLVEGFIASLAHYE